MKLTDIISEIKVIKNSESFKILQKCKEIFIEMYTGEDGWEGGEYENKEKILNCKTFKELIDIVISVSEDEEQALDILIYVLDNN